MDSYSRHQPKRFFQLVQRRERLGLTGFGRLVVALLMSLAASCVFLSVYPFLAVTKRVTGPVLVVEGWIHEVAIRAAAEEFRNGAYEQILTTGGPMHGTGVYTNDYHTSASLGADRLRQAGVPSALVQMVPARAIARDRTYESALALRDWLKLNKPSVRSFNIATESVHARRTRLLFCKAFKDQTEIGIIAIPNPDYDSKQWWRYSEGVRDVIGESIAYIYARFFFFPSSDLEKSATKRNL